MICGFRDRCRCSRCPWHWRRRRRRSHHRSRCSRCPWHRRRRCGLGLARREPRGRRCGSHRGFVSLGFRLLCCDEGGGHPKDTLVNPCSLPHSAGVPCHHIRIVPDRRHNRWLLHRRRCRWQNRWLLHGSHVTPVSAIAKVCRIGRDWPLPCSIGRCVASRSIWILEIQSTVAAVALRGSRNALIALRAVEDRVRRWVIITRLHVPI